MLSAMRARFPSRLAAALLAVAAAAVACSTVPYTDRTRVILLSRDKELALGAASYQQTLQTARISQDPAECDLVRRVGARIARVAPGCEDFAWEFSVIDDRRTVNAFCLPGGKVCFYTGILPVCATEVGVAVVMGHEVAHAVARHGAERISQQMVLDAGAAVLTAVIAGKSSEDDQAAVRGMLGAGFGVAFALPFSRKHESEADHIGLMLMAQAGYDPREAPRFWERMEKLGGKQPPAFLSTHPSHEKRKEDLEDLLSDAMPLYEKAIGHKVDYTKQTITAK
jgi:predicted Zn-dependent protease